MQLLQKKVDLRMEKRHDNDIAASQVMVKSTIKNPVISAVIAVYNMESRGYLRECLESLEHQNCKEVEYVLIDDCSTDDSLQAIINWAQHRSDTTVVALQRNSRQGTARNRGIDASRGEYISIVDPDDIVSKNYFSIICNTIKEQAPDVVVQEFIWDIDSTGEKIGNRYTSIPSGREYGEISKTERCRLIQDHWQLGTWTRSLFNNTQNYYPEGLLYEDTPTVFRWLMQVQSVGVAKGATYYRRVHPSSTTATTGKSVDAVKDRIVSSRMILDAARELGVYEQLKHEIDFYYYTVLYNNTLGMLDRNNFRRFHKILKQEIMNNTDTDITNSDYFKSQSLSRKIKWYMPRLYFLLRRMRGMLNQS